MLASVGIALGCLIWGASVSLGLSVVLQTSEIAYTVIKLMGAAYLIWLGMNLLLKPRSMLDTNTSVTPPNEGVGAFWRGFLTNLLNPKVGLFYITFLPQFVPVGSNVSSYIFFLAFVHVALTLIWFSVLIAATKPLIKYLNQPSALMMLDRLTGGIFLAFGAKLATSSAH